ncbi:MAG: endonuclease domain-containing protein [Pseudomonadota bacterium]
MDKPYVSVHRIERARDLRVCATEVEKRLWWRIRDRQLDRYKFRRQHPVGPFILDFACEEAKLAIELDGGQHGHPESMVLDSSRTATLEALGWRVLRFWNHEVIDTMDGVLETIRRTLTRNHEG